ncbi:MAG: response regulator [Bacteroidota bacterium]
MKTKPKILIVDDKPENLVALRTVLKDLELELIEASSGNEALKKTLHHDFALALLDVQMPEMDGYELAKILREEEKTAYLPFIFISAVYTHNMDVFKGYEKGAFSFITKPFQPEMLINKVKFFIDRHQQEVALFELNKDLKNKNKELAFQNEAKEKQAAELIIANKDLTTFTYVSSHDLQEPLRKIQNFVSLIFEDEVKNLSDNGKGYFKRMQETAKGMQALIEDLLTYSRTKTTECDFEKTDLQLILNETKSNFEEVILEKKAIIEVINLSEVNIIPLQFRQLVQNLIGNSLKFSKPDLSPHITIECKIEKGSRLTIEKVSPEINYCQIIFTDNGIGFDPQYQDRIFEVFQRLHSKEQYKGTGIGLAICKRIVENHKGFITATGKLNEGARFDIYIPAI